MAEPGTITRTSNPVQARVLGLAMLLGPARGDAALAARLAERLAGMAPGRRAQRAA